MHAKYIREGISIVVISLEDAIPIDSNFVEGSFLYRTEDGAIESPILEEYVFVNKEWKKIELDTRTYASGAIQAALKCVGSPISTFSQSEIKTVGTNGNYADLAAAMSAPDNTRLVLLNNQTISTTLNVTKPLLIDGAGFQIDSTTSAPVNMINFTNGGGIVNTTLIHRKTTNTSVERVININSTAKVYIQNNNIQIQEIGVAAKGSFILSNNKFSYIGSSATNSHRFILIYGTTGDTRISYNEFEASNATTTRYSNFILMTSTSGTAYEGKLYVNNNIQTGGKLRQFLLHEAGVTTGLELYVANNQFNDFNGGIGIISPTLFNSYSKIGIYNNLQGGDAAGNFKGVFFVDGTGTLSDDVEVTYGDNQTSGGALRADYLSLDTESANILAYKNTVVTTLRTPITTESIQNDLGFLLQDLKSNKTYIVDGAGIPIKGEGSIENPYELPETTYAYNNEWHVDPINGLDINNGSEFSPFKTVAKAQTVITGTGNALYLHVGTYTESVNWDDVNADIIGASTGGLTRLEGNWTFSHTASSVRVRNCAFAGSITHSAAGSLYFNECQTSGAINKTGAGYFEANDCDFAGAGFTVSGAGFVNLYNAKLPVTTINNASAVVTIQDSPNSAGISIIAGNVSIFGSLVFSSGGVSAALASQNEGTVFIRNSTFYKPDGSFAPISLSGAHSIDNSFYDDNDSVLTGDNLGQTAQFDAIKSRGLITASSILIPWVQTKEFASGVIVEKDSKLYQSNASIPADTAFSEGTTGATWKLIGGASGELITTSLTPSVAELTQLGNVEFLDAQADLSDNVADVIKLSDGSFINTGKVTWTAHGLDVGAWYYLSQDTAGEYVTPAPTEGILQKLFFVEDENTIHINIIGAASATGTEDTTITYQDNSSTKPDDPNKGDLLFVTEDGTRSSAILEQWLYDGVEWIKTGESSGGVVISGTIIDNTIADSNSISTVGRYIIPSTGTENAFVGQENNYADWYGEVDVVTSLPIGFTFVTPTNEDRVVITSSVNAGKIFSFDGTSWIEEEGTAAIPTAGQLLTITNGATITSPGNPDSAWSNVAGGQFTIPSAGKWDVEYCLSFTSTGSNNQARIVNIGGVEVAGSRSAQTTAQTGALHSMNTGFQLETTGAGVYQLQARTFNNGTITVRNPTVTTGFPAHYGQSVIKWTKTVQFPVTAVAPNIIIEQNYVSAINSGSDQTLLTAGTDLRFSAQGSVAGTMVYNPATGVFSGLVSGKTYDFSAFINFFNFTFTSGYVKVSWVNATTNTEISGLVAAVVSSVTRTSGNESSQPFAGGRFTAPSNMSVKLRVVTAAGNSDLRGSSLSSASIQEVTGVAIDPALMPVNDQIGSEFFDIGNMRIQTGRDTSGNASTRTITLPAPFANTNYRITYGCEWNSDNLVRSGNTVAKTTTSFTARVQHNEGGSATNFEWIAIGRKP
jgi:hypothetical protein